MWWRNTAFTRNHNVDVVIYDTANPATRVELRRIPVSDNTDPPNPTVIALAPPTRGQVVRLEHTAATDLSDPNNAQVCLAEVQVYGPPAGFDAWAEDMGLSSANNRMDQDPDGDGSSNLLEYALGGDPLSPDTSGMVWPVLTGGDGETQFAFTIAVLVGAVFGQGSSQSMTASVNGITYQVEGSADLVAWAEPIVEVAAVTAGLPAAPAGYEYHSFMVAGPVSALPKLFVRARLSSP